MEKRIAGFSPSDAGQLRCALTHQREKQRMKQIGREFASRALVLGCSKQVAESIFSYIEGYAGIACEASLADDAIRRLTACSTVVDNRHIGVQCHRHYGF